MSKAVLVIDMPNDCYMCPCYEGMEGNSYCMVLEKDTMINTDAKPKDCPLKPLPQIKEERLKYLHNFGASVIDLKWYAVGHDDCIDEILEVQDE